MGLQSRRGQLLGGLIVGLVFGCADLTLTWLNSVEDDSPLVLLRFYGPMFLVWSILAFGVARGAGRLWRERRARLTLAG